MPLHPRDDGGISIGTWRFLLASVFGARFDAHETSANQRCVESTGLARHEGSWSFQSCRSRERVLSSRDSESVCWEGGHGEACRLRRREFQGSLRRHLQSGPMITRILPGTAPPDAPFARYVDDTVIHRLSQAKAGEVLTAITERFEACGL